MQGKTLKAASGWFWVQRSTQILVEHPKVGFAFFCAAILLWQGFARIPIIGNLLQSFIQPLVVGILAVTCNRLTSYRPCGISATLSATAPHVPSLLRVGFISIASMILSAGFVLALTDNIEMAAIMLGDWSSYNSIQQQHLTSGTFSIIVIPFIVSVLITFATWFAPPLITICGCSVKNSLLTSLTAVRVNSSAFVLYGLIFGGSWLAYLLLMYLIPGILLIPIGQQKYVAPAISALSSLYWPLVAPIMLMSVYVGFVDIFCPEEIATEDIAQARSPNNTQELTE